MQELALVKEAVKTEDETDFGLGRRLLLTQPTLINKRQSRCFLLCGTGKRW